MPVEPGPFGSILLTMKTACCTPVQVALAVLLTIAVAADGVWAAGARERSATGNAVSPALPGISLIELFTSEGCSSCPPADAVLASLLTHSREAGTPVYALAWHVGYWNDLGWKDPYTLKRATARQQRYATGLSSPLYTPEIVVNGTHAASEAGSLSAVERLVDAARKHPALASVLVAARPDVATTRLSVRVATTGAPPDSSIGVALVQDGLVQRPDAGENAGRTLRHDAVVRSFSLLPATGGVVHLSVPPAPGAGSIRVVAFVQTTSLAIVGANELELGRKAQTGATKARIAGRLLDGAGRGVANALVQACSTTLCLPARTDPTGRYSVTGVPAGHYDIKLFLPRRDAKPLATLPVEVRAGEDISLPPLAVRT